MRPIRRTLTAAGVTPPIPLDHYRQPFNVGLGIAVTGTLTFDVEHTFDDVFAPNFNPATATWYKNTALTARTTSSDGNYIVPIVALRLNVTAFTSGSATITVVQAGMPGE